MRAAVLNIMYKVLELSQDDFKLHPVGENKSVLATGISGLSLTMFYSHMCGVSKSFLPVYSQLPKLVHGCYFTAVNISKYPNIIRMSERTILPLTEVPFIVLSYSGVPRFRYMSEYTVQSIKAFIINANKQIANDIIMNNRPSAHGPIVDFQNTGIRSQHTGKVEHVEKSKFGIPIYGTNDTVSYLKYNEYGELEISSGPSGKTRFGASIV